MGVFSKILNKLGLKKDKTSEASAAAAGKPSPVTSSAKPSPKAPTVGEWQKDMAAKKEEKMKAAAISEVDVVEQLETLGKGKGLNWKVSIVDLLTLLQIDSSRESRNELAKELGCPEEFMSDSAKMNTWLHKTVLKKIAENGGNIPKDLLD